MRGCMGCESTKRSGGGKAGYQAPKMTKKKKKTVKKKK